MRLLKFLEKIRPTKETRDGFDINLEYQYVTLVLWSKTELSTLDLSETLDSLFWNNIPGLQSLDFGPDYLSVTVETEAVRIYGKEGLEERLKEIYTRALNMSWEYDQAQKTFEVL